jgi:2,3-bisphosphoglycerate-dependent phosphoglycerate mutase
MKSVTTTFYLIRHGEIDANVSRRWHGSTDSELNENGRLQARRMAAYVAINHPEICAVYHSPLQRTLDTAIPLARALDLDPLPEKDLREYSIGKLENTRYEELHTKHDFFAEIAADQDFAPPDGESPNTVCQRMEGALTRLGKRHEGEAIAIVSHGAAMGIVLSHLLEDRVYPFHNYHMTNTGYSKLIWGAEPKLEIFNASEHLAAS